MKRLTLRIASIIALFIIGFLGVITAQIVLTSPRETTTETIVDSNQIVLPHDAQPRDSKPAAEIAKGASQKSSTTTEQSAALLPGKPHSLKEIVNNSEAIVVGRISSFKSEGLEGPYSTTLVKGNSDAPDLPKIPVSYFELEIIEIITNQGSLEFSTPILLRLAGLYSTRSQVDYDPPFYEVGDKKLYTLNRNPDGSFYTSFGSWGAINLEGEVVTFPDRARTPITFTDQTSPDAFIKALKEEAAK